MTRIDKACYERGCACHDDRVDGETVEVVQRTWVGLTDDELIEFDVDPIEAKLMIAKLKEKNT